MAQSPVDAIVRVLKTLATTLTTTVTTDLKDAIQQSVAGQIQPLSVQVDNLQRQIDALEAEKAALKADLAASRKEVELRDEQIEARDAQIKKLEARVAELSAERDRAASPTFDPDTAVASTETHAITARRSEDDTEQAHRPGDRSHTLSVERVPRSSADDLRVPNSLPHREEFLVVLDDGQTMDLMSLSDEVLDMIRADFATYTYRQEHNYGGEDWWERVQGYGRSKKGVPRCNRKFFTGTDASLWTVKDYVLYACMTYTNEHWLCIVWQPKEKKFHSLPLVKEARASDDPAQKGFWVSIDHYYFARVSMY